MISFFSRLAALVENSRRRRPSKLRTNRWREFELLLLLLVEREDVDWRETYEDVDEGWEMGGSFLPRRGVRERRVDILLQQPKPEHEC